MQIKQVAVRKFLAIEEATIDLDGAVTIIGGDNGAGKSSIFKAMMAALCGKKHVPADPVHDGDGNATVTVTTEDGIVILATVKPDRGYSIKISNAEGFSVKSPASWLAERFGNVNPVGFLSLDGRKQGDVIRDMVGVDTSDLDERRKALEEDRVFLGRQSRDVKGAAEQMPHHEDAPAEEVSLSALRDEERVACAHNDTVTNARHHAEDLAEGMDQHAQNLADAQIAADKAADRLIEMKETFAMARTRAEEAKTNAESMVPVNVAEIEGRMAAAESTNAKVRANAARVAKFAEADTLKAQWQTVRDSIDELDTERITRLAAATFPVDGLSFDIDGGLTYNGHPFDTASAGERVCVAFAVYLATNPGPVCVIEDASLLDASSLAAIKGMAEEAGVKVLLERVGDSDPGAIVIEDGKVRG